STFFVDTHAPSLTVTASAHPGAGPDTGAGFPGGVDVSAAATDPSPSSGTTVRCIVDPPSVPVSYAAIPDGSTCPTVTAGGPHKAYAAASDAAGNRSAVASVAFSIIDFPDTQLTR
ncbi:MAG: hypothetical protein AAGC46_14185, partial [Solirubrobacteraceae bacterium]